MYNKTTVGPDTIMVLAGTFQKNPLQLYFTWTGRVIWDVLMRLRDFFFY